MTQYVFMCKRTGNLLVGTPVWFGATDMYQIDAVTKHVQLAYQIVCGGPHGYILEHQVSGISRFFNRKAVEELFENLGEL